MYLFFLKFGNLFLGQEDGEEITANSLHPGAIVTNLFDRFGVFKGNLGGFKSIFKWFDLMPP